MASERNRILEIISYFESLGIEVNVGKNKARGNKGFFKAQNGAYRIDISKGLDDSAILRTLIHEFAHYIHFQYDKTLKSLDFLSKKITKNMLEELLDITVLSVSKEKIKPIFKQQEEIESEIINLKKSILKAFSEFDEDTIYKKIEDKICKQSYKHLLKYDRVKVITPFSVKIYSIDNINAEDVIIKYLKLKSKQRLLKKIKSKISRINRYYNQPTELWARSFEFYVTDREVFVNNYPSLANLYNELFNSGKIQYFTEFIKKFALN